MWLTQKTSIFEQCYKKLSPELKKRTDDAIIILAQSDSPALLWIPKKGRWKGYFAYEIGNSYRLIYKVIDVHAVLLVVVGDHKTVYGRD